MSQNDNIQVPGRSETIAIARKIIEKYQNIEVDPKAPPQELLLAKGTLAMYGEILLKKASAKYGLAGKYLKIAIDAGMRFPDIEQ